jgi:SH3-like domain-containing protein
MSRLAACLLIGLMALATVPAGAQTEPAASVPVVKPPHGPAAHRPAHHHEPAHQEPARPREPRHVAKPATKAPQAPPPAQPAKPPPPKPDPTKGTTTGLKLPRWVALRSDDVNVRTGPGMQYPIDWQYHRRDLPVIVLREFEVWRLIQLQDGTKGWVHQATLTGRRGFLIVDSERVLRSAPDDGADPVAKLEPGVVGHIRSCEAGKAWCEVQTGEYRGWLKRTDMWGVDPDEAIN